MYKPTTKEEAIMLTTVINRSKKIVTTSKYGQHPTYVLDVPTLSDDEKQVIFEATYFVGLSAFAQNPSEAMEKDIFEHLFAEDVLMLTFNNKFDWRNLGAGSPRVIGFFSFRTIKTENETILYLSGMCIDPAFQGYRIGKSLLEYTLSNYEHTAIAMRTQNPVAKQNFDLGVGGESYPNGHKIPEDIIAIGELLATTLNTKEYHKHSLVCRGAYGSSMYGIDVNSRNNDKLNTMFNRLNRAEGDAIFCIKRANS